jgi:hypothetical protein
METSLEILKEQIENLKKEYYVLIGQCNNVMEFSNYTVSPERDINDKTLAKSLNDKIKNLYQYMLDLREEIEKL